MLGVDLRASDLRWSRDGGHDNIRRYFESGGCEGKSLGVISYQLVIFWLTHW